MGTSWGWCARTGLLAALLGAATATVAAAGTRTRPFVFGEDGPPSPVGSDVYSTLFRAALPAPAAPRYVLAPALPPAMQQPEVPPEPKHTGFTALVRSTGSDFKSFPMRRSTWVILGVGGALSAMALPIDDEVNEELGESTGAQNFFKAGKYIGYGWVQGGAAVGIYLVGRYAMEPEAGSRTNKVSHLGFDLLRATILTQALTYGLKYTVRRDRPTGECCSFPSGHASVTFATASVIERHFGYRAAWPTFLVAGYVGASRLAENKHFLSDVIFGAALGMASGWTVVGRHGRDNFALFPTPVKGGVAITGYWTPGAHHIADGP